MKIRVFFMPMFFATILALICALIFPGTAMGEAVTPAEAAFERFCSGSFDIPTMVEVLPQLSNPERREKIRATLLTAKSPPRAEMVALLDHPLLAVRLGALELLEELAGGDLSYNPWTPAESPENLAAIARWKSWAGQTSLSPPQSGIFSAEQRHGYLRDLLADDPDKATRARRMLEAEGLAAVGFLENFLNQTPTLPTGSRTRIREAQYQITLSRHLGDQAAVTARHLAFGSRDQLLTALSTTRRAGLAAIPILRDFLVHADPLVRETAIDSLLACGGGDCVPILAPLLTREPDVNVIHGALRRLKDIRTPESEALVASFLTHPDEDLLVSAIQTSLTLGGENRRYSPSRTKEKTSSQADPAVLKCLADPRWRVRSAALEYVAQRKLTTAKDPTLKLLDDPDEFVRFAAIKAVVALGAKDALPKFKALMLANPDMIGPVVEGYGSMKQPLDAEMLAKLDASPPEARLSALAAAKSNESLAALWPRYAADPNLDVACAALRGIASSDDQLNQVANVQVIVAALKENRPEKNAAILENLDLPVSSSSSRIDPALLRAASAASASPGSATALDPLYEAFRRPGNDTPPPVRSTVSPDPFASSNTKIPSAALPDLLRELTRFTSPEHPPTLRFSAALNLAKIGEPEGCTVLLRDLPSLTSAQKSTIGSTLRRPSARTAVPLLTALLRDPSPEVRKSAAEACFSNEKATALVRLPLDELATPGSPLLAHELYAYRFDYAVRQQSSLFRPWCLAILQSETSTTPQRVLATLAARHQSSPALIEALRKHTSSSDPNLRRAAWFAIISARPTELAASAAALAADPDARVRAVLPNRITKPNYSWQHLFSDSLSLRDEHSSYSNKKVRINETFRPLLTRLASQDPSQVIRFEAAFALLQLEQSIDLPAFCASLPKLPKDLRAPYRVGDWLGDNAKRATPALQPLLAVIDTSPISEENLKTLKSRLNPKDAPVPDSFSSLSSHAAAPATGKNAPLLAPESQENSPSLARTSLKTVFFIKPGCHECAKAREILTALQTDFPLLQISEFSILEARALVLNQALCSRLGAPSAQHSIAPAIFTQAGYVIGPDITVASVGTLLAKTLSQPQDNDWDRIDEPEEIAAATAQVEHRYESITLPIVLLGGLLDGINPCAFATIIFFLSYLRIARRTPREMLMVGAAFISAVFLAYLAAGLLLHSVLASLNDHFAHLQRWLNGIFAALALIAAALSLRDALRARAGRIDEMSLQLPEFLKNRIRRVIRSGTRARRFVLAAFFSGIAISLLELACTGQVYAPIIYQIQKGRLDAVLWLVLYNLAFITPLVVIFLLAYTGLRSESLIAFQKKHTSAVKLALALLFLILAVVMLMGL